MGKSIIMNFLRFLIVSTLSTVTPGVVGTRVIPASSLNINSLTALESFVTNELNILQTSDEMCDFKAAVTQENVCAMDPDELDSLVSVQTIIRHGERTPLFKYVNDPYQDFDYGIDGLGQLTGDGKYWSYVLGKYIRCRYDGFLSSKYSPNAVFCQSSEIDRTMMTASSVLAALFPPTRRDPHTHVDYPKLKWQPIPCSTIPSTLDNKINQAARNCPRYKELFMDRINTLSHDLDRRIIKLFRNISEATGNDIQTYDDIYRIYDTIMIQHCQYGLPFPSWFPPLAFEMRPFYEDKFYEFVETEEMKRFIVGPILNHIVTNFDNEIGGIKGRTAAQVSYIRKAKMYLFFGHDTTISPILHVLGVYDKSRPPPYNSALFFELHKTQKTFGKSSQHLVKIFYRTEPGKNAEELHIPGCTPCTYQDFKKLTEKYRVDDRTWEHECGISTCP